MPKRKKRTVTKKRKEEEAGDEDLGCESSKKVAAASSTSQCGDDGDEISSFTSVPLLRTSGDDVKGSLTSHFMCNYCEFSADSKTDLVSHMRKHMIKCPKCQFSSLSRKEVTQHCKEEHDVDFETATQEVATSSTEDEMDKDPCSACVFCKFMTYSTEHLERHTSLKHPGMLPKSVAKMVTKLVSSQIRQEDVRFYLSISGKDSKLVSSSPAKVESSEPIEIEDENYADIKPKFEPLEQKVSGDILDEQKPTQIDVKKPLDTFASETFTQQLAKRMKMEHVSVRSEADTSESEGKSERGVKVETIYCLTCPYSSVLINKLKCHTLAQHPLGAAVATYSATPESSLTDYTFFCVKQECPYSTGYLKEYQKHLMQCCSVIKSLKVIERERLKSTLSFIFELQKKHTLDAEKGFSEYASPVLPQLQQDAAEGDIAPSLNQSQLPPEQSSSSHLSNMSHTNSNQVIGNVGHSQPVISQGGPGNTIMVAQNPFKPHESSSLNSHPFDSRQDMNEHSQPHMESQAVPTALYQVNRDLGAAVAVQKAWPAVNQKPYGPGNAETQGHNRLSMAEHNFKNVQRQPSDIMSVGHEGYPRNVQGSGLQASGIAGRPQQHPPQSASGQFTNTHSMGFSGVTHASEIQNQNQLEESSNLPNFLDAGSAGSTGGQDESTIVSAFHGEPQTVYPRDGSMSLTASRHAAMQYQSKNTPSPQPASRGRKRTIQSQPAYFHQEMPPSHMQPQQQMTLQGSPRLRAPFTPQKPSYRGQGRGRPCGTVGRVGITEADDDVIVTAVVKSPSNQRGLPPSPARSRNPVISPQRLRGQAPNPRQMHNQARGRGASVRPNFPALPQYRPFDMRKHFEDLACAVDPNEEENDLQIVGMTPGKDGSMGQPKAVDASRFSYCCLHCGKDQGSKKVMKQHMKDCHNDTLLGAFTNIDTGQWLYFCPQLNCAFMTYNEQRLSDHLQKCCDPEKVKAFDFGVAMNNLKSMKIRQMEVRNISGSYNDPMDIDGRGMRDRFSTSLNDAFDDIVVNTTGRPIVRPPAPRPSRALSSQRIQHQRMPLPYQSMSPVGRGRGTMFRPRQATGRPLRGQRHPMPRQPAMHQGSPGFPRPMGRGPAFLTPRPAARGNHMAQMQRPRMPHPHRPSLERPQPTTHLNPIIIDLDPDSPEGPKDIQPTNGAFNSTTVLQPQLCNTSSQETFGGNTSGMQSRPVGTPANGGPVSDQYANQIPSNSLSAPVDQTNVSDYLTQSQTFAPEDSSAASCSSISGEGNAITENPVHCIETQNASLNNISENHPPFTTQTDPEYLSEDPNHQSLISKTASPTHGSETLASMELQNQEESDKTANVSKEDGMSGSESSTRISQIQQDNAVISNSMGASFSKVGYLGESELHQDVVASSNSGDHSVEADVSSLEMFDDGTGSKVTPFPGENLKQQGASLAEGQSSSSDVPGSLLDHDIPDAPSDTEQYLAAITNASTTISFDTQYVPSTYDQSTVLTGEQCLSSADAQSESSTGRELALNVATHSVSSPCSQLVEPSKLKNAQSVLSTDLQYGSSLVNQPIPSTSMQSTPLIDKQSAPSTEMHSVISEAMQSVLLNETQFAPANDFLSASTTDMQAIPTEMQPEISTDMQLMPSNDMQMQPTTLTDLHMQPISPTENQMQSLPSTDIQRQPVPSTDMQMQPLPSTNMQMHSAPVTNSQVEVLPPRDMQMQPVSVTEPQKETVPPSHMHMHLQPAPVTGSQMGTLPPLNMQMQPAPVIGSQMETVPPSNAQMQPAPVTGSQMETLPPSNMQMQPAPVTGSQMETLPPSNAQMQPAPVTNSQVEVLPPRDMQMQPVSVTEPQKETVPPSHMHMHLQPAPVTGSQMGTLPPLNMQMQPAPVTGSQMETLPPSNMQMQPAPVTGSQMETLPPSNMQMQPAPVTGSQMETLPPSNMQMQPAPVTGSQMETLPPSNAQMQPAPVTGSQMETLPPSNAQMQPAPVTGSQMETLPPSNAQMQPAPVIGSQMETLPPSNTQMQLAPVTGSQMETLPPSNMQMQPAPVIGSQMETLPPSNMQMQLAPVTGSQMETLLPSDMQMQPAPMTESQMERLPPSDMQTIQTAPLHDMQPLASTDSQSHLSIDKQSTGRQSTSSSGPQPLHSNDKHHLPSTGRQAFPNDIQSLPSTDKQSSPSTNGQYVSSTEMQSVPSAGAQSLLSTGSQHPQLVDNQTELHKNVPNCSSSHHGNTRPALPSVTEPKAVTNQSNQWLSSEFFDEEERINAVVLEKVFAKVPDMPKTLSRRLVFKFKQYANFKKVKITPDSKVIDEFVSKISYKRSGSADQKNAKTAHGTGNNTSATMSTRSGRHYPELPPSGEKTPMLSKKHASPLENSDSQKGEPLQPTSISNPSQIIESIDTYNVQQAYQANSGASTTDWSKSAHVESSCSTLEAPGHSESSSRLASSPQEVMQTKRHPSLAKSASLSHEQNDESHRTLQAKNANARQSTLDNCSQSEEVIQQKQNPIQGDDLLSPAHTPGKNILGEKASLIQNVTANNKIQNLQNSHEMETSTEYSSSLSEGNLSCEEIPIKDTSNSLIQSIQAEDPLHQLSSCDTVEAKLPPLKNSLETVSTPNQSASKTENAQQISKCNTSQHDVEAGSVSAPIPQRGENSFHEILALPVPSAEKSSDQLKQISQEDPPLPVPTTNIPGHNSTHQNVEKVKSVSVEPDKELSSAAANNGEIDSNFRSTESCQASSPSFLKSKDHNRSAPNAWAQESGKDKYPSKEAILSPDIVETRVILPERSFKLSGLFATLVQERKQTPASQIEEEPCVGDSAEREVQDDFPTRNDQNMEKVDDSVSPVVTEATRVTTQSGSEDQIVFSHTESMECSDQKQNLKRVWENEIAYQSQSSKEDNGDKSSVCKKIKVRRASAPDIDTRPETAFSRGPSPESNSCPSLPLGENEGVRHQSVLMSKDHHPLSGEDKMSAETEKSQSLITDNEECPTIASLIAANLAADQEYQKIPPQSSGQSACAKSFSEEIASGPSLNSKPESHESNDSVLNSTILTTDVDTLPKCLPGTSKEKPRAAEKSVVVDKTTGRLILKVRKHNQPRFKATSMVNPADEGNKTEIQENESATSEDSFVRRSLRERKVVSTGEYDITEMDELLSDDDDEYHVEKDSDAYSSDSEGKQEEGSHPKRMRKAKLPPDPTAFDWKAKGKYKCWQCRKVFLKCGFAKTHLLKKHADKGLCSVDLGQSELLGAPQLMLYCPRKCRYATVSLEGLKNHTMLCEREVLNPLQIAEKFVDTDYDEVRQLCFVKENFSSYFFLRESSSTLGFSLSISWLKKGMRSNLLRATI